jgi:hypothetical protein
MGTVEETSQDYGSEIIGYTEPWITDPGQTIAVKVSQACRSSFNLCTQWMNCLQRGQGDLLCTVAYSQECFHLINEKRFHPPSRSIRIEWYA